MAQGEFPPDNSQNTLRGRFMDMVRDPETRERAKRIAIGIGAGALKSTVQGAIEGFAIRGGLPGAVTGGLAGAVSGARESFRSDAVRSEVHGMASDVLGNVRDYAQDRLNGMGVGDLTGGLVDAAHGRAQGALADKLGAPGQSAAEQPGAYQTPVAAGGPR